MFNGMVLKDRNDGEEDYVHTRVVFFSVIISKCSI